MPAIRVARVAGGAVANLVALGQNRARRLLVAEGRIGARGGAARLVRAGDGLLPREAEDINLRELASLGRRRLRRREADDRSARTRKELPPAAAERNAT
jgi:hypothetical protein